MNERQEKEIRELIINVCRAQDSVTHANENFFDRTIIDNLKGEREAEIALLMDYIRSIMH